MVVCQRRGETVQRRGHRLVSAVDLLCPGNLAVDLRPHHHSSAFDVGADYGGQYRVAGGPAGSDRLFGLADWLRGCRVRADRRQLLLLPPCGALPPCRWAATPCLSSSVCDERDRPP